MFDEYTGNPTPVPAEDANTQPNRQAPTFTLPTDGVPWNAETFNKVFRPIANLLARLKAKAGFLDLASTWTAKQTFQDVDVLGALAVEGSVTHNGDLTVVGELTVEEAANLDGGAKVAEGKVLDLTGAYMTGGTGSGQTFNAPTLDGGTLTGTLTATEASFTGGTFNGPTLTTPTINEGTLDEPIINGPTVNGGTITGAQSITLAEGGVIAHTTPQTRLIYLDAYAFTSHRPEWIYYSNLNIPDVVIDGVEVEGPTLSFDAAATGLNAAFCSFRLPVGAMVTAVEVVLEGSNTVARPYTINMGKLTPPSTPGLRYTRVFPLLDTADAMNNQTGNLASGRHAISLALTSSTNFRTVASTAESFLFQVAFGAQPDVATNPNPVALSVVKVTYTQTLIA